MSRISLSFSPAFVAALVSLIAVSGCAGSHGGSALPQNAGQGAAPASAAIRGSTARTQRIDTQDVAGTRMRAESITPSNVTTAEPPVTRPNETPCVVQLFSNQQFVDFSVPTFQYTPPAACPGPWAKVVLSADFSVTAGRQFDRTGSIWIAGTNVYFGTTAEPSANRAPSWHVERNLTDLSAIFHQSSTGEVILGNIVNGTYTGVISGSAQLAFYPANDRYPAPDVADNVYPLSGNPLGGNQSLPSAQQPLTATLQLPPNVRAAYLDVFMESQIGDEFWYTCFPNDLAQKLNNCGNTAFREGEVAVDGRPAGVAPIYPWIYTGGIDPYLWRPIPGIETLNFKPYRVNLTPFAGVLSDGNPHTITVNVFNDDNYFDANGALLVYTDHHAAHVTGGIISDTTALDPSPAVTENVVFNSSGTGTGPVDVSSTHDVNVDGYVQTSDGRVETRVAQTIRFTNDQQVDANLSGTLFDQTIKQDTSVQSVTTTTSSDGSSTTRERLDWPLTVVYDFTLNPDNSYVQTASVQQGRHEQLDRDGQNGLHAVLDELDSAADTLNVSSAGIASPTNGKSSQSYNAHTSRGYCYVKNVASLNYIVTQQTGGFCGNGDGNSQ